MPEPTHFKPEELEAAEATIRRLRWLAEFVSTLANNLESDVAEQRASFDPIRQVRITHIAVLERIGNNLHHFELLHRQQLLDDADLVRVQQSQHSVANAVSLISAMRRSSERLPARCGR